MPQTKWSDDAFLNRIRSYSDDRADQCVATLKTQLETSDFGKLFALFDANDEPIPSTMPAQLKAFFDEALRLPTIDGQAVDMERIKRGEQAFMSNALVSALVLLTKSLPSGYAAPNLSQILVLSGNLRHHPFKRLLGVLQMLINVTAVGGFDPKGKAIVTGAKMRLLHAGVRSIVPKYLPDFKEQYGTPVNLEDMLGTIMGFSYLVIEGLQQLEVGMKPAEAEDYYYLWRVFAQLVGIHPPGQPDSSEFVPASVDEAAEFYRAYARRHFTEADKNPAGVSLTQSNIDMLNSLLPQTPLRRLGLKIVPRIYVQALVGNEGCKRVGVRPVPLLFLTKFVLLHAPALWVRIWDLIDRKKSLSSMHERLSRWFFQDLISKNLNGEVTFMIPDSLADLRKLTVDPSAAGKRAQADRRRVERRTKPVPIDFADRRRGVDRRVGV